jgi:ribosomal protein S18 acetylase RimI-like enzyme
VTNIRLRDADARDEAVLWEMLYLALFVPPGGEPLDRAVIDQPELARYVRGWGRPGDDGTIAITSDDETAGAAWIRLWPDDDRGYGFIDPSTPELSVAVRPQHRGRGVGTRLLRELLARADGLYDAVSLSVSIENPAVHLYERCGFVRAALDGPSITMRRTRLTPR